MKKKIKIIIIALLLAFIPNVQAEEKVKLYLFWGDGCSHCEAEQEYLADLEQEFDNLEITKYEVWHHEENNNLLKTIATSTNKTLRGVPVTIIGPTIITGFNMEAEKKIKRAIEYYTQNKHDDIVQQIKDGTYKQQEEVPDIEFLTQEKELSTKTTITIPILGKINFKNMDLPITIPILGLLTSLSLPGLWLLISYASMVSTENKKKNKIILLMIGLITIGITGILSAQLNLKLLNCPARIWILISCIIFALIKLQKIRIPNIITNVLIFTISIAIGILINPNYWNILKTLISSQELSFWQATSANLFYFISYLIPYILILFICHTVWKNISKTNRNLIQLSIFIATTLLLR